MWRAFDGSILKMVCRWTENAAATVKRSKGLYDNELSDMKAG